MQKILISRIDKIGDVILTLPLAGIIKKHLPNSHVCFLGQNYTSDIINSSKHIDSFLNWSDISAMPLTQQIDVFKSQNLDAIVHVFPNNQIARLAKLAKIPTRIGTRNRFYHLWNCNHRLPLSRKNSTLHEAELNLQLLKPLINSYNYTQNELHNYYGLSKIQPLSNELQSLISRQHINVILHPKSKGSACEWPLNYYVKLTTLLPKDKFKIFITGSTLEAQELHEAFPESLNVTNLAGKLTLNELMGFINACDGLVAASTGPLHIAAALGRFALGLYPKAKPMHAERWGPLGKHTQTISTPLQCKLCKTTTTCTCMQRISIEMVATYIYKWQSLQISL